MQFKINKGLQKINKFSSKVGNSATFHQKDKTRNLMTPQEIENKLGIQLQKMDDLETLMKSAISNESKSYVAKRSIMIKLLTLR